MIVQLTDKLLNYVTSALTENLEISMFVFICWNPGTMSCTMSGSQNASRFETKAESQSVKPLLNFPGETLCFKSVP